MKHNSAIKTPVFAVLTKDGTTIRRRCVRVPVRVKRKATDNSNIIENDN